MKPGDMMEVSIWLKGTETPEQVDRWMTIDARDILREAEERHNITTGPLSFTIKRPGEERVPQVPDHIHGPDVRLLVGEAKVGPGKPRILKETGFVADLDKDSLARLRQITRRAHAKQHPGDRLSDAACDTVIEALGPETAVKTLRQGHHDKLH